MNKTKLFSQPPVSLSCFTSCQSVNPTGHVALISVFGCTLCVCGVNSRGYLACCLLFLTSTSHFLSHLYTVYPWFYWFLALIKKKKKKIFREWFEFVLCIERMEPLSPGPSVDHSILPTSLCMTGCFVSLSSCWVQRTAGTSYKAWCRTFPLNPHRPPLYQDQLAPGKVRLPQWMCFLENLRLSSSQYSSSASTLEFVAQI